MNLKELIKPENILYIILMLVASVVAIYYYGTQSLLELVVVLYCILQLVFNISTAYVLFKRKLMKKPLNIDAQKKVMLIATTAIIVILFFTVLTDYFQRFVLYYSAIILLFLLVYDVGKMVLQKGFR